MNDEELPTTPNPFARPGFIVSAVLVIALVVAAFAIGLTTGRGDATETTAATAAPVTQISSAPPETTAPAGDAEGCGPSIPSGGDKLAQAPTTEWAYQGTLAYPTSPELGPLVTTADGARQCYQHSPDGAAVMTANMFVMSMEPTTFKAWLQHALSDGPNREAALNQAVPTEGTDAMEGLNAEIQGVRVLQYDGETARVDLLVEVVSDAGDSGLFSVVLELLWEDNDWKLDSGAEPLYSIKPVTSASGYHPWRA